ncbi:hypothetical protein Ancab_025554 [Ancistrocladus abbreviatus]
MASGTLGAEEAREKHRWNESSKVYTRKIHNKGNKKNTNNNQNNSDSNPLNNSTPQIIQTNQNTNGNTVIANTNGNTVKADTNGKCNTDENNVAPQHSSQARATKDGDSLPQEQEQQLEPQQQVQLEADSNDSSSLNRQEAVVPNGHDDTVENGVVRPVVTQYDNRVNINLVAARSSKQEVKELKRRLVGELDQVRSLVKKLEAKESQLSGHSSGAGVSAGLVAGTLGVTAAAAGHTQYSANDGIDKGGGLRVNSGVGSVGFNDSRPFRQLTVSVMDNNNLGVREIVEKEKRTPKANQYYRNSDFVLGKEKFPPAESNKKLKSGRGKKHGGGGMDYGFGMDKQMVKSCSNLLQKLMKHKHGWVFNQPVDVKSLGLIDYFEIIKQPMDLGTVKNKLNKNWYKSPKEFAEDVRLTFRNAMTYNPKGQDVHIMAEELSNIFESKWLDIEAEYNRKLRYGMVRDVGLPIPTSRKTTMLTHLRTPLPVLSAPPMPPPPALLEIRTRERSESMTVPVESRPKPVYNAPVGRTPAPKKPKAKDPHKRDMTYEEKQRLSTNLQSLPSEKLDNIVQIIKKRDSALCQHDDEIEVDIDSVDAETLWELDRFVTNYKKSLSKHKRKAEIALQRAAAGQTVQGTNPAQPQVEAPKETRPDERNETTSSPVQGEKQADNASGSSSSSSSSSETASSSSDSDSDSSSGYGSDAGH